MAPYPGYSLPVFQPNCAGNIRFKCPVTKPIDEGSLPHIAIADQDEFHDFIIALICAHLLCSCLRNDFINYIMTSKLKGKMVKDYTFGETLSSYSEDSLVAHALKGDNIPVTAYAIHNSLIDPATFPIYNNQIAQNKCGIYPMYYEIVRSQNYLYMIFQNLSIPAVSAKSQVSIQNFIRETQRILFSTAHKLSKNWIFMKNNGSGQLCIIPPYIKGGSQKSSNIYSKFHNKSVLAELFVETVPVSNKKQLMALMVENFDDENLVKILMPSCGFGSHENKKGSVMRQIETQYPDIDDKQFEELMTYVHVNPSLKQQAGEAFIRQSSKARHQETSNKEITNIIDNIKSSIFMIKQKEKGKGKKVKYAVKLPWKKVERNEFEVNYEAYTGIFSLFKKTIKSYLQRYKNGFAGIIAAYLLTLIGILRRLELYNDLNTGKDVFNLDLKPKSMDYSKQLSSLKQQLGKQAKILSNLKVIIENANMPFKTYEALLPYLEDELELIDMKLTQNFCFFYMTVLMRMKNCHEYHQILALETMNVLISNSYEIVYSEEDMPKQWNQDYYEMKKALIYASVPEWEI